MTNSRITKELKINRLKLRGLRNWKIRRAAVTPVKTFINSQSILGMYLMSEVYQLEVINL
jgi:hypothetical protein